MNVEFGDEDLKRLATEADFRLRQWDDAVTTKYRQRVQLIQGATDERDFYSMKSLHFEKLRGQREGQYSMRLNKQWRLILTLRGEAPSKVVRVVAIEDYH